MGYAKDDSDLVLSSSMKDQYKVNPTPQQNKNVTVSIN